MVAVHRSPRHLKVEKAVGHSIAPHELAKHAHRLLDIGLRQLLPFSGSKLPILD